MSDIVLVEGENKLDVAMTPTIFDPWQYDADKSCYIKFAEWAKAAQDYGDGIITEVQYNQVAELYQYGTRNPACISPPTDYLDMTKDELYQYLINKSVARDWWTLSYLDRRTLGLKIIKWWSVDWFGSGLCLAGGGSNCSLPPQFNPYQQDPVGKSCIYGRIGLGMETCAGFRYCLFTDNSIAPDDLYWWRGATDQWHCYDPGVCFGLPTAVATGDADWLNCLQLDQNVGSLDSWIFFQTWLQDGYPSCDPHHWPIISGAISIMDITGIDKDRGFVLVGNTIAEIHY